VTASVVITGPLAPADVGDLLTGRDRSLAQAMQGYRGIPTSELVKALLAAGASVEVVTHATGIEGCVELEGPKLRILVAPRRERARALASDLFRAERQGLRELLDKTEGDVVHAHWTYEFAWAALDTGRPVLVTAHDAPLTILRHVRDPYRAVRAAMAYIVRTRIRNLTAVSPYLAQRWRREMLYRRPITVIPNIAPRLIAESSTRWVADGAALVDVTDAGRLKNVGALLEALVQLRAEGRDLTLNLVGAGLGADDDMAKTVRARGLGDGVEFHGILSRESLAAVLARSTVFVHPSLEEACPMSILEAMNAGLPVVGGIRSGGVPWLLDDGRAGMLVDVERPADIADAVCGLLDDDAAAREIASRGRERIADCFSGDVVAHSYLEAYARTRRNERRWSR
jgi:L-malate glycosyltransferase